MRDLGTEVIPITPVTYRPVMQPDDLRDHFTVRLKHSDAAGVIFFANAFQVEQEFFERWLEAGGLSLRGMLDGAHAPTPVTWPVQPAPCRTCVCVCARARVYDEN